MARKVKCGYCSDQLEKEDAVSHKKRYYHPNCLEVQERDKEDRASLISYICELYKLEYPTGMILKQIKNYIEVNKYKYKGIELALKFFYEIQDNPVNFDGGIGIVQYCYEAAKQDYIKRMKIAESIDNLQPNEEITVYIDLSATKRKSKKIDIANI